MKIPLHLGDINYILKLLVWFKNASCFRVWWLHAEFSVLYWIPSGQHCSSDTRSCHKHLNFYNNKKKLCHERHKRKIKFTIVLKSNISITVMIFSCLLIMYKQANYIISKKNILGKLTFHVQPEKTHSARVTWQLYLLSSNLPGEFNSLFQSEDSALAYDTAPWHSCALTLKWERE